MIISLKSLIVSLFFLTGLARLTMPSLFQGIIRVKNYTYSLGGNPAFAAFCKEKKPLTFFFSNVLHTYNSNWVKNVISAFCNK